MSLETLQVIFDLITHSYGSFGPSLPTYISSTFSSESIHRESILEILLDIIITNTKESTYYARNCIDWLREVCDETPDNCQKVLKYSGFHPILVLLSIWNVGYDHLSYDHESDSASLSSSVDMKIDKLFSASASSNCVPIDLTKKIPIKSNFSLNVASEFSDLQDIESHPDLRIESTEISVEENKTKISRDYKPIELDHIPNNKYPDIPRDKPNVSNQLIYEENYKLQLSCSRLIKQLIQGTSMNIPNHGSNFVATGFSSSHISLLLSFALFAGRFINI